MSKDQIVMYGADWCGDCRRSERLLNELGVEWTKIDVEADLTAADKVIEINGGAKSIPVIVFQDGTHLTEPSDFALTEKLKSLSIINCSAVSGMLLRPSLVACKLSLIIPFSDNSLS